MVRKYRTTDKSLAVLLIDVFCLMVRILLLMLFLSYSVIKKDGLKFVRLYFLN